MRAPTRPSSRTGVRMGFPTLTVTLNPTTKSETELQAVQKAWDELFEKKAKSLGPKATGPKPKRKKKRKRKRKNRKKKKKTGKPAWTDEQRAEWARAHYHQHHGPAYTVNCCHPVPPSYTTVAQKRRSDQMARLRLQRRGRFKRRHKNRAPPMRVSPTPSTTENKNNNNNNKNKKKRTKAPRTDTQQQASPSARSWIPKRFTEHPAWPQAGARSPQCRGRRPRNLRGSSIRPTLQCPKRCLRRHS